MIHKEFLRPIVILKLTDLKSICIPSLSKFNKIQRKDRYNILGRLLRLLESDIDFPICQS